MMRVRTALQWVTTTFKKVNAHGVPYVGLLLGFIVSICLVIMGVLPAIDNAYTTLADFSCCGGVFCMLITVISSMRYKSKFPEEYANLPWHLRGKSVISVIALIGAAILLYACFSASIPNVILSIIAFIIILLIFELYSKKRLDTEIAIG